MDCIKCIKNIISLAALQLYTENPQCIPPNNKVIICFGEEFPDMKPMNKKLIIVEVRKLLETYMKCIRNYYRGIDNSIPC